ncbi:MAG: His/Gly/Thr/Pro-type tRNA ligase C-terminal domain-containing protein [Acidimicrobiales bacterium]
MDELRRAGIGADRAFDGRSMKSQMKAADRSGARVALIVGSQELEAGWWPCGHCGPAGAVVASSGWCRGASW